MRVSVIIPAYRVAPYIAETIDSVLAQTFQDFELIVVNDASPDTAALEAALTPYGERIRYLVHQTNAGPSKTRNTGIEAARGEWVAFLDGDDLYFPEYLEVQIKALEDDPAADAVYGDAIVFGDDPFAGMPIGAFRPSHGPVTVSSLLRDQVTVLIMSVVRRKMLLRVGLFDESIRKCEDFDLWLRIVQAGGKIVYHSRPIAKYRIRGDSASADPFDMFRHRMKVLDKAERTLALSESERAALADARVRWPAEAELEMAKRAFQGRRYSEAATHLRSANQYLRRAKYTVAAILLGASPGLVKAIVDGRDSVQKAIGWKRP